MYSKVEEAGGRKNLETDKNSGNISSRVLFNFYQLIFPCYLLKIVLRKTS